jgi:hypothetical protein
VSGVVDTERLARLVSELSEKDSYAFGVRRFPRSISDDEAAAIAEALAAEVDEGTAARERAATARGCKIACHTGCNACCAVMVMVFRPEALAIARWLKRPENAGALAAFVDAYGPWRASVGDLPEQLSQAFAEKDASSYKAFHQSTFARGVLCAFNRDGKCSIYAVRPIGCRNAHALETSERCGPENSTGKPREALAFVPLDRLMSQANRLLRATHNATSRTRHQPAAVCAAVYDLL